MTKSVYKIIKDQNGLETKQEVQVAKHNIIHVNKNNKIELHISSKDKKNIDDMVLAKDGENLNIYFNDGTSIVVDKFYDFSDNQLLVKFDDKEITFVDSISAGSDKMLIYGDESYAISYLGLDQTYAANIDISKLNHYAAAENVVVSDALSSASGVIVQDTAVAAGASSAMQIGLGVLALGGLAAAAGGGGGGGGGSSSTPPPAADAPTAAITLSDTQIYKDEKSEVKIVFSEKVNGFSVSDLVVPNGSISGLSSVDNITWTGVYTPAENTKDDTNVISLKAGSYTNAAGVSGAKAESANFAVDTTVAPPPALTVTITDDELATANIAGNSVLYTFTFSEAVVGFDASDVVVTNGTKGTFSQINPTTYTMEITPTLGVKGNMTVDVPAGVATSIASSVTNNASYQSVQKIDTVAPTVVSATLADTALIAGESTEFTVVFSEAVDNFSNADLDMSSSNGILSTLSSNDGGVTWKALFTPNENINDATNTIKILNTYTDKALNNGSLATSTAYTIDTTTATSQGTDIIKPVLAITDDESAEVANLDGVNADGTADANGSNILYTFEFSDAVNDFIIDDIAVTNGTRGTFTKLSDTKYTLMVIPTPGFEGVMSVTVDKLSYQDVAGNTGSDSSDTVVYQTVDMRAPFPDPFLHGSLSVTAYDVEHNRLVLTFDENLEQVNQVNPDSFAVKIGGQEIKVTAVGVSDNVAGMQDNQVFLYLDGNPTNARGELYDWINAGITVTYTDTSGDLPAIIHDLAGNDATSFNDYVLDNLAPDAKIEMSDGNLSSGDVSVITFKFSEVVNLSASDINLTDANGTIDKLKKEDGGNTWTAEFTPTNGIDDMENVISLNTTYTDIHGNNGIAVSSANYTIDTLAPRLTGATGDGSTDTIMLTFNEELDAVNFADLGMFTVTDGITQTPATDDGNALQPFTVKAVAIDGNKAILSIDANINSDAGTTWKLTYSDPTGNTANALQDLYGSDVISFTTNIILA